MYESARSRTCLHAKHQPCQADNVPALRGPRHACWRGGGIRRKAHEVAWTRVSQATRRFPFRATLPLPRNAFPSAQRFPFHATLSLPRNAFPSAQRFPFHATFSLPRNIFPSTQRFPFHATFSLPRNSSPSTQRFPFHATFPLPRHARATSSPSRGQRRRPGLASLFLTKDTRSELAIMERVLCICGHRYTASGHRSHWKKAYLRCCDTIFVCEAWLNHHSTTGHNGVKVNTWTKTGSLLGYGLALQRDRMERCHKSEHDRCTECHRIFIYTDKKEHEHSTKHVSYMLVPPLDQEHAGAVATTSTHRTYEPQNASSEQ